jgi:hypothetical protein
MADYGRLSNRSYDEVFTTKIKKLAPRWFIDVAAEKRQILLGAAENGWEKPKHTDTELYYNTEYTNRQLASMLTKYRHPGNSAYNKAFATEINKSQWFK